MSKFKVHWRRSDRCYSVVSDNGKEIARVDEITEAWAIAEQLERDHAQRAAVRQATLSTAARSRSLRSRSAFALRG